MMKCQISLVVCIRQQMVDASCHSINFLFILANEILNYFEHCQKLISQALDKVAVMSYEYADI